MRLVLQRVKSARVEVDSEVIASIGLGTLVFAGFGPEDEHLTADCVLIQRMAHKIAQARFFSDDSDKLNLNLKDIDGSVLAVSQFSLHADCRKGHRPSLHHALTPDRAAALFNGLVRTLETYLPARVRTGRFGANMDVILHNWGPLTLVWDSQTLFGSP